MTSLGSSGHKGENLFSANLLPPPVPAPQIWPAFVHFTVPSDLFLKPILFRVYNYYLGGRVCFMGTIWLWLEAEICTQLLSSPVPYGLVAFLHFSKTYVYIVELSACSEIGA